jgi:hypothetical protein
MKSQTRGAGQAYLGTYTDVAGRWLDGGSIDLYVGPAAPGGRQANWVQTIPGRHWFSYMRFYEPLEPYFDRSWKLGDITAA